MFSLHNSSEFDPEEELDDDRTQIRPVHASVSRQEPERRYQEERRHQEERRDRRRYEEEHSRRRSRYDDEEEDYPRRNPVWPVFLAAAAVLLFVGLIDPNIRLEDGSAFSCLPWHSC